MDHSQFAATVREALSQPGANIASFQCNDDSKQNAAVCMTAILSNRLAQTGDTPEPLGRTTFRWNGGVVNFRNAVRKDHWTNIRTDLAEHFHGKAATMPAAYVMTAWAPTESAIHIWVIPENVVYEALPRHKLAKSKDKRLLQIIPTNQRFERCKDSPDLKQYYVRPPLSAAESSHLAVAARVDHLARERKSEAPAKVANAVDTSSRRSWIFQANPQVYDVVEALKHLDRLHWSVRQHKDEIRLGDRVFLWVSGTNAGVVARARAVSDPDEMEERPEELRFYSSTVRVIGVD